MPLAHALLACQIDNALNDQLPIRDCTMNQPETVSQLQSLSSLLTAVMLQRLFLKTQRMCRM